MTKTPPYLSFHLITPVVVITFYIETALRRMRPWNSPYMCTCNAFPSIAFTFKVLLVRADRLNLSMAQQQHLALGERKQAKGRGLGGRPSLTKDLRHKQNDSTEPPSTNE